MVQQSSSERIETTILRNLFFNEDFTRKALPFIEGDYFSNSDERELFLQIEKFVEGYKNLPTKETINIELGQRKDLTPELMANFVKKFKDTGATILGGCCETRPSHIKEMTKFK